MCGIGVKILFFCHVNISLSQHYIFIRSSFTLCSMPFYFIYLFLFGGGKLGVDLYRSFFLDFLLFKILAIILAHIP